VRHLDIVWINSCFSETTTDSMAGLFDNSYLGEGIKPEGVILPISLFVIFWAFFLWVPLTCLGAPD